MIMFQNTFQLEGDVLIGEHIFHGVSTTSRRYVKDGRLVIVSGYPPPPFFFFSSSLQLYCPTEIFPIGNLGRFCRGKISCNSVALPNLRCTLGGLVFP